MAGSGDWTRGELQARIAGHRQQLQKPLSDAIRHSVRTEMGIPEGEEISSTVFDVAASLALGYLTTVQAIWPEERA